MATSSIARTIKTKRPIRIFHRILMARNNAVPRQEEPLGDYRDYRPGGQRQDRRCSDDPGPESTLKEALLVAENQVNQGKNTAGTHPEQDWMIKNRLYPR